MRRRHPWYRLTLIGLLALGSACSKQAFGLDDRPCRADDCVEGYVCNPITGLCAPKIVVDCEAPGGTCPYLVHSGDTCDAIGAFLPCLEGRSDCLAGCRTCQEAGTWSACSPAECILGSVWSCAACDDDCRVQVRNADPICIVATPPPHCGYSGECRPGGVDRDGVAENGCECLPTIDGVEVCDGEDNDCDTEIDEDVSCGLTQLCQEGRCRDCTATDPSRCGATCAVCEGATPACVDGSCQCSSTSCGASSHCRPDGTCEPCGISDAEHCGATCQVCSGTTPICSGGDCACDTSSCGTGARCKTDSGCVACNESAYCGDTCAACPAATPICESGACRCDATSCPDGQYCAAGACVACVCPALFSSCVDAATGGYVCRCDSTSCGAGGSCVDGGTTCEFNDACSSDGGLMSVCTTTDDSTVISSTWARGTPTGTGTPGCRSAGGCWATGLTTNYASCEKSCIKAAPLNLSGVNGTVSVSFWAAYMFEWGCCDYYYPCSTCGWDGVTPRFLSTNGWEVVSPVSPAWDVGSIHLGVECLWAFSSWPAYATENPGAAKPYAKFSFQFDSASAARFFHPGFGWRVYLQSDNGGQARGWTMDDIQVRVTLSP